MADKLPLVPIARPDLGKAEADAVARTVLSRWVAQGAQGAAFESAFAAFVGAPHACAVSSCSTALHLALLAVGVGPGDQVVVPSHTFIATANSIRHCGAVPVFVDIDPDTFNATPEAVAAAISPRTKAILCVHQMGMPSDLEGVLAAARDRGVPVVEDAACAAGSEVKINGEWQRIGRPRGAVACFSFHARKVITTGEGGMLTTADAEIDRLFRRWRHHGMTVPDTERHGSATVVFERYLGIGYNYRMSDIQAAVGVEQVKRLADMVAERRRLAARYRGALGGLPGVGLPEEPAYARSNWQSFCVRLPDGLDQKTVMQAMLDAGVATRRGIMCCHREEAYAGMEPPGGLPHSEQAQDRCILLPLFDGMTATDQDRVVAALRAACG